MRDANPALTAARFRDAAGEGVMTVAGTAWRALALVVLTIGAAGYTWWHLAANAFQSVNLILGVGFIGGLVVALATAFMPRISPWSSPFYAVLEGMALGALSALMNAQYQGLPTQAVVLTFGIFVAMLTLYLTRVIRVTERFKSIIFTAILGILIFYLVNMVLRIFGIVIPGVHEGGAIGIGVSLFIVGIASFALLIDFNQIEEGAAAGAPKYMEWYGAFGLLVGLVWLYIEVLNLLRKLRR